MQYQTENNVLNVARRFEDRFEQVPDVDEFEKEHTSLHARREWPNRRPTPRRKHYIPRAVWFEAIPDQSDSDVDE